MSSSYLSYNSPLSKRASASSAMLAYKHITPSTMEKLTRVKAKPCKNMSTQEVRLAKMWHKVDKKFPREIVALLHRNNQPINQLIDRPIHASIYPSSRPPLDHRSTAARPPLRPPLDRLYKNAANRSKLIIKEFKIIILF